MSLSFNITVFNREDLTIIGTYPLLQYDLIMDAIENSSSTLVMELIREVEVGDYVAVRPANSDQMFYYGQIITADKSDSSGTLSLSTNFIWNVLNGDVPITSRSGYSYETHIISMINMYTKGNSAFNVINSSLSHSTDTDFSVAKSDGVGTSNFVDYIIRGFKLHNTIMDVTGIGAGTRSNGKPYYYPKIDIHQTTEVQNFSNNIFDFQNWSVTDSKGLRGYNNELWIIDKNTGDGENPNIRDKYWLQNDGSVVHSMTSNVVQPTQIKMYIFDSSETDAPSFQSIAQSELQGNSYSHNIKFDMPVYNDFLPLKKLKLGLQSNIYYNGAIYKSILSRYSLSSSSDYAQLEFGNLRFGRQDLFGN